MGQREILSLGPLYLTFGTFSPVEIPAAPPNPPGKCQRVRCAIQHSRGLMPLVAAQRQFIAKSICMCTMPLHTDVHVFLSGM